MSDSSNDLCVIFFEPSTKIGEVRRCVLNAFLEGILRFKFVLRHGRRRFEDRVALSADTDEACALEMAGHQFERFVNTVTRVKR